MLMKAPAEELEAVDHWCPQCQAGPGHPCIELGLGGVYTALTYPHYARIDLFYTLRDKLPACGHQQCLVPDDLTLDDMALKIVEAVGFDADGHRNSPISVVLFDGHALGWVRDIGSYVESADGRKRWQADWRFFVDDEQSPDHIPTRNEALAMLVCAARERALHGRKSCH